MPPRARTTAKGESVEVRLEKVPGGVRLAEWAGGALQRRAPDPSRRRPARAGRAGARARPARRARPRKPRGGAGRAARQVTRASGCEPRAAPATSRRSFASRPSATATFASPAGSSGRAPTGSCRRRRRCCPPRASRRPWRRRGAPAPPRSRHLRVPVDHAAAAGTRQRAARPVLEGPPRSLLATESAADPDPGSAAVREADSHALPEGPVVA